jgi:hypothetical protein
MADPRVPLAEGFKTVGKDTSASGLDTLLTGLGISKEEILANFLTKIKISQKAKDNSY